MRRDRLSAQDYPLAENRPDLVRGQRGKSLDVLNLATLESGDVVMPVRWKCKLASPAL